MTIEFQGIAMLPTPNEKPCVYVVDDNADHLSLIALSLETSHALDVLGTNYIVQTFTDASDALASLPPDGPVVIICDYNMPGSTGLDWLPAFLKPNIGPVIMLTSSGDERIAVQAFRAGASDYLVKSDVIQSPDILYQSILKSLRLYKLDKCYEDLSRKLKITNAQLERKNERLSELTESAHRFVDNVAHEFRTPLTVIMEFASIISDGLGGPVTPDQNEYLQYISAATRDLAQLVDDFLDSSKLRARTLRVNRTPHTITELFESVRTAIQARAEGRKITMVEDIAHDTPQVFSDMEKAGRVILNLAINAIKFSPEGEKITLWAKPHTRGGVEIGITDRGPGLAPEQVTLACQRFQQIDDPLQNATKGFGLGLDIATQLIHLNLGELNIQSRQGVGSTFAFTLPQYDPQQIIDQYIEQMLASDKSINLSVLRVRVPADDTNADRSRKFLVSNCRPMDLVFDTDDRQNIILVGPASDANAWISRLESHWETTNKSNEDTSNRPIEIQWLGTWSGKSLSTHVPKQFMDQVNGVKACA